MISEKNKMPAAQTRAGGRGRRASRKELTAPRRRPRDRFAAPSAAAVDDPGSPAAASEERAASGSSISSAASPPGPRCAWPREAAGVEAGPRCSWPRDSGGGRRASRETNTTTNTGTNNRHFGPRCQWPRGSPPLANRWPREPGAAGLEDLVAC